MNPTDSQKPQQPQVNQNDESFDGGLSLTEQSMIFEGSMQKRIGGNGVNDRFSMLSNIAEQNHLSSEDISPQSRYAFLADKLPIFESESNRSSKVFERSDTQRHKDILKRNLKMNQDCIRVSSLKDLLRLFRVNLNEDNTFQYGGQSYCVDLIDLDSPLKDEVNMFNQTGDFLKNIEPIASPIIQEAKQAVQQQRQQDQSSQQQLGINGIQTLDIKFIECISSEEPTRKDQEIQTDQVQQEQPLQLQQISSVNQQIVQNAQPSIKQQPTFNNVIQDNSNPNVQSETQSKVIGDIDYLLASKKAELEVTMEYEEDDVDKIQNLKKEIQELEAIKAGQTANASLTSQDLQTTQTQQVTAKEQVDEDIGDIDYLIESKKAELEVTMEYEPELVVKIQSLQKEVKELEAKKQSKANQQNPSANTQIDTINSQIEQKPQKQEPDMDYLLASKKAELEILIEFEPEEVDQIEKLKKEIEELEAQQQQKKNAQAAKSNTQSNSQTNNHHQHHHHSKALSGQVNFNIQSQKILQFDHSGINVHASGELNNLMNFEPRDSLSEAVQSKFRRIHTIGKKNNLNEAALAQLQKIQNEKQQLMQKLSEYTKLYIDGERNVAEAPLHLAFIFATPLVVRKSGQRGQNNKENFSTMPLLEFKKEFKEIKGSIAETKRKIRLRSMQATIENLTRILAQNPLALHFSGHGLENNEKNFGRQAKVRQNEGNYLLFETEDGEGDLVSEKQLQEFITSSETNLEFVFVASCYSEFAGKIFLNAGAKHVICVRQGQEIADQAVITFSRAFYNSVFSQSMTICQSFEQAKNQVKAKFGPAESNKFNILKRSTSPQKKTNMPDLGLDSKSSKQEEHKCKIFGPLKQGDVEFLDTQPRFREFPAKVDNFIGRQKELFEVVHNVMNNRLVNVIGLPGIGKTSLCKNAIHYIADRKLFKQGIIFMQLKGYMNCEIFMKKLVSNFVLQNFDLEEDKKREVKESNAEQLLGISLIWLKQLEDNIMIVFDNAEDLLYYDKKAFRNLVNDLVNSTPYLHVLLTSRTTLGALQDISEKILVLQEMNPFFTVDLFISRAREIAQEEIKELLDCQPENHILVGDATTYNKKVTNLAEHHLFKILGGNPHAIILAAPLLIRLKLKELYMILNSKEMYEVLKVDGIQDSTVASLRLSLEASIKILEKEDQESLKFFFFIGMLPGGIFEEELGELWGPDYQKHVDKLMNLSLISKKDQLNEKAKLILPPFMVNYAEAKIEYEDKEVFNSDICAYYAKICKEIYLVNGKAHKINSKAVRNSELTHQLVERLLKHETNIWACFYRMVDIKPIQQEEVEIDLEDLHQDANRVRRFSTLNPSSAEMFKSQLSLKSAGGILNSRLNNQVNKSKPVKTKTLEFNGKHSNLMSNDGSNNSDTTDKKPFEINVEPSPIPQDDGDMFTYKKAIDQHNQKSTFRFIDEINEEIKEEKEEEEERINSCGRKSQDSFTGENELEDYDENDDEVKVKENKKSIEKNKLQASKRPTKDITRKTPMIENQQLDHIIRNSIVNFQRKSILQPPIFHKDSETEKRIFMRRQTMDRGGLNKNQDRVGGTFKKKRINELQDTEKLIVYYAMNQYLLHENENALRLILNYALKMKGSTLYEANIKRVLGLTYLHKRDIDKALVAFKEADELYKQKNSIYGQALTKFSIGYLYRSKVSQLVNQINEDEIFMEAKSKNEQALKLFKDINHIMGMAVCHKQLAFIQQKLGHKNDSMEHQKNHIQLTREFNKYPKKNCVHIQRVHDAEISLMTEVVTDNENKNLFPQTVSSKTFKDGTSILKTSRSNSENQMRTKEDEAPLKGNQTMRERLPYDGFHQHQQSAPFVADSPYFQQSLSKAESTFSSISGISSDQIADFSPELQTHMSTDTSDPLSHPVKLVQQMSKHHQLKIQKIISALEVVEEEDDTADVGLSSSQLSGNKSTNSLVPHNRTRNEGLGRGGSGTLTPSQSDLMSNKSFETMKLFNERKHSLMEDSEIQNQIFNKTDTKMKSGRIEKSKISLI